MPVNSPPSFLAYSTTDFAGSDDFGNSIAIQSDGKVLVAGQTRASAGSQFDFALARYNTNGTLDTSFGAKGKLTLDFAGLNDSIGSVTVQLDGKVVVAGYSKFAYNERFALARYNADGSVDSSFGINGQLTTDLGGQSFANQISVRPNGKILVSGFSNPDYPVFAMSRYNANGTIDTSFGTNGKTVTDFSGGYASSYGMGVQVDGKIILAGGVYGPTQQKTVFALARYSADGVLDATFGNNGKITTSFGALNGGGISLAMQGDGKIVVAGTVGSSTSSAFALARYNSDGTLDTSFDVDGMVTTSFGIWPNAFSVMIQSDGKIVIAGTSDGVGVIARYNSNGTLDTTFDIDGIATVKTGLNTSFNGLVQQQDGRILTAGSASNAGQLDFSVVRLNVDGSVDPSFMPSTDQLPGNPLFLEKGPAAVLSPTLYISDLELNASGNFAGAVLTLTRSGGANTEDVFSSQSSGGTLSTLIAGSYFSVDSITIGRVVQNGGGTLTLSFTANATQPILNRAMQQIAYANTSSAPPSKVQIDWTFNDGNTGSQGTGGALSITGKSIVSITPVNDPPQLIAPLVDQSATAGTVFTYSIPMGSFIDPDIEKLSYSLSMSDGTGVPPWLTFNTSTQTFTGTPTAFDIGILNLRVTVKDVANASADGYFRLSVLPQDRTPPTIAVSSTKSSLMAGDTATLTFTLSEPSTNFIASDVTVSGGTLSNFTGSGNSYNATFTPTANSTANGVVSVASGVFTDAAGNANVDGSDANNTVSFAVDTLIPTIAVSSTKSSLIAGDTATLTFTLSEPSTNFVASDVTVSGGTLSNFTGGGTSYTATLTPTANSTTSAVVGIASGVFTDVAGNANADGSDANNRVTFTVNTLGKSILGTASNDNLTGSTGNDSIDGGAGIDIVSYGSNKSAYTVVRANNSFSVSSVADGIDTLINVERLKFADTNLALDLGVNQSAGQTALLIGAVLPGKLALDVSKQGLLGSVIGLFDLGYSTADLSGALLRLDIWSILTGQNIKPAGRTLAENTAIVNYLMTNVNGTAPDAATLKSNADVMHSEAFQGAWLAQLALSNAGQSHIGLIGLASTGLVYA